jgi:hypothetical protein
MTDLSERTERTERTQPSDPPAAPDAHPAAGPPVIQFVPAEGERLEQLATERRGPVRWTASAVLTCQALVRRTPPSPDDPPIAPAGVVDAPMPVPRPDASRQAGHLAARRRRVQPAQPARVPRPALGLPAPAPMPGSGWAWNAHDEKSWEAWEACATSDTDHRLASLDSDLERPLPAPVRWARFVGGRKGRSPAGRAERRENPDDDT